MAVYTQVSDEELHTFLESYDLPSLVAAKGIAEGTENSNYLLMTTAAPYILTLYEARMKTEELPFFIGLMEHLAGQGVLCPRPVRGRDGEVVRALCGRPAAITTFLPGASVRRIQPGHCSELGRALAGMHLTAAGFAGERRNALDMTGWRELFAGTQPEEFQPGLGVVLQEELDALAANWPHTLPRGVIHADLFPDNVFFLEGKLSGLIDFYFACTDAFAYELAICLNAWCFEHHVAFNVTKARQLLSAYNAVRPLNAEELAALPLLCRGAALRFLLTRLADWPHKPPEVRRNPDDYLRRLRFHQQVKSVSEYGLEL